MMAGSVGVKWAGAEELQKLLEQLPANVQEKALKNALKRGGAVLARAVKDRMPIRTGLSRESIGYDYKRGKNGGKVIVGPRRSYKRKMDRVLKRKIVTTAGWRKRWNKKHGDSDSNPVRIMHLIEKGHKGPHPADGKWPIATAMRAVRSSILDAIFQSVRDRIAKEQAAQAATT